MQQTFCQDPPAGEGRRKIKEECTCPLGGETLAKLHAFMGGLQEKVEALQKAVEEQTTMALAGYPLDKDGKPDTSGHRSYHEEIIEQAKARTEYWREMTFELSKYGLIGFVLWAATQLWAAFINGLKQ